MSKPGVYLLYDMTENSGPLEKAIIREIEYLGLINARSKSWLYRKKEKEKFKKEYEVCLAKALQRLEELVSDRFDSNIRYHSIQTLTTRHSTRWYLKLEVDFKDGYKRGADVFV